MLSQEKTGRGLSRHLTLGKLCVTCYKYKPENVPVLLCAPAEGRRGAPGGGDVLADDVQTTDNEGQTDVGFPSSLVRRSLVNVTNNRLFLY